MKNATAPHITPVTFPAPLAIDTTPVTQHERGRWLPAPRKAYAIVSVRSPLWGYGDKSDQVVGFEITGPMPVFINAGKTLVDAMGISSTFGDEIFTAIACTRKEYIAALASQRRFAEDFGGVEDYFGDEF